MANSLKMTAHYDTSKAEDHPVHGVFGGVAPQGHIAASFYVERWALPKRADLAIEVDEASRVQSVQETPVEGKEGVIRTVTATYYIEPAVAEAIGRWLLEKAAESRTATQ